MAIFGKRNSNEIDEEGHEMSFIDHLEVLRWHIIRSVVAILFFTIGAFIAKDFIFDTLIFGPTRSSFPTFRALCKISSELGLGNLLCMSDLKLVFINTELAGQFLMHLKISFSVGMILGIPYAFYEIWTFVKPGLKDIEVKSARGIVFFASMLFFIGVTFGYFILSPFALLFFSSYSLSDAISNTFTITNYISFLSMFVMVSGVIFELPMIVYFLSTMGLVTPSLMREYRRHAIVILLVIAAIITPPDVGTQILVFIPVYFLYEISIFISARVERRLKKEMEE